MTKIVTEKQQNQAVEALKRLVSKPSVNDESTKTATMPFGKGIDDALTEILKIAEENGLKPIRILTVTMAMQKSVLGTKSLGLSATLTLSLLVIQMIGTVTPLQRPSRTATFMAGERRTTRVLQWQRCLPLRR